MKIDELVKDAKTVGLTGHVSPDGDCVGSCMAVYLYLKKNFPEIRADVFLQEVPQELKILPDADVIRTDFKTDVRRYDVFFCLDSGKDRTDKAEKLFDRAKRKVNIDHHVTNPGCGDDNLMVPEASSCCEIIYDVLSHDRLDADIAMTIYAGIVTDTGSFRYSCTSPKTLRTAAELLAYGFDASALVEHVQFEKTYRQNLTIGKALTESRLLFDEKLIITSFDAAMMKENGIRREDTEGCVSQMNLTSGVACAAFIYASGENEYKLSLRSKGDVDVSVACKALGGGGHVRAAGATMHGASIEEIEARVIAEVEKQINNVGSV